MAFDNMLEWLAEFELGSLFAYLIAAFFCLVLGYRVWDKYGRNSSKKALLEPEKLLDELDAIEAESTQTEKIQTEPQQEGADVAHELHEPHEAQEPRASTVPVQLDLLGFSTKQK